jgi:hypothetical protein
MHRVHWSAEGRFGAVPYVPAAQPAQPALPVVLHAVEVNWPAWHTEQSVHAVALDVVE